MKQKAFTFTESVWIAAAFGILLLGVTTAFWSGRSAWEMRKAPVDIREQVQLALVDIVRDLSLAGSSLAVTQTTDEVSLVFDHPVEGSIKYIWTKNKVTGVGDVTRQASVWRRVVARNISALSLMNNGSDVFISITAMQESSTGKMGSMTLTEKVMSQ